MKNKSKNVMYRHGDVILEEIKTGAKGDVVKPNKDGKLILAEGELTGHAHRLDPSDAQLFIPNKKRPDLKLLVVNEPVALRHEEHGPIVIPKGKYKVRIKRQYTPQGWERVED